MVTAYIASSDGLLIARRQRGRWHTEHQLEGTAITCIASNPLRPEHIYCGTYGQGVWRSINAGASWTSVGDRIRSSDILSVAVSSVERAVGVGVVYASSEPTALFRSEDAGSTWHERPSLTALPSAATWSFPPKPWTHHARWITLDPSLAGRVWVCVEAGALVRSDDSGQTWHDRQNDAPYDTHTLRTHPLAPGRLYAAAGDGLMAPGAGYVESRDGGTTWERLGQGLHHHYLWGLAVDPNDPDTRLRSQWTSARASVCWRGCTRQRAEQRGSAGDGARKPGCDTAELRMNVTAAHRQLPCCWQRVSHSMRTVDVRMCCSHNARCDRSSSASYTSTD